MKQPVHSTAKDLRRGIARDLGGARALSARARNTRQRELSELLAFAAQRRLRRTDRPTGRPIERQDVRPAERQERVPPQESQVAAQPDAPVLLARDAVSDDLLRLTVSRPSGFRFRPGQHVKLGVSGLLRNYSLVSAPHEPHLEFFVELFRGGRLSERLRSLDAGARMAMADRAKGDLRVDQDHPNQLLVATVTGIAPYVSMLRDHEHRAPTGPRRFIVLHGASYGDELGYREELTALAERHPETVAYLPTVSRPENARNADWAGARGRVESQVAAALARFGLTPANTAVFACGHPEMVRNVAGDCRRRGFTAYTEAFD